MQIYMYIIIINIVEETLTQKKHKKATQYNIYMYVLYVTSQNRIQVKIFYLLYLFNYKLISAISRDRKLRTCRLSMTITKNKAKTPGYNYFVS